MLKLALGVRCGCLVAGLRREEDAEARGTRNLLVDVWSELSRAAMPLPIVATGFDWRTLESVLDASTMCGFDCFMRVDPYYRAEEDSPIEIQWDQPGPADDRVGFSDSLQSQGTRARGSGAFVRSFVVNGRVRFYGYGPTREGCWAQRELPEGQEPTLRRLFARARALGPLSVGLDDLLLERIRMAPSAGKAYARIEHAVTVSGLFELYCNVASARNPQPDAWMRLYDRWDELPLAREEGL